MTLAQPILVIGVASGERPMKPTREIAIMAENSKLSRVVILPQPAVERIASIYLKFLAMLFATAVNVIYRQKRTVCFTATSARFAVSLKNTISQFCYISLISSMILLNVSLVSSASLIAKSEVVRTAQNKGFVPLNGAVVIATYPDTVVMKPHNNSVINMKLASLGLQLA